jgi:IS5 family transposase
MIPNLIETYCLIDNLTRELDKELKTNLSGRKSKLSRSELLTIAVIKQNLGIKTNKSLYNLIKDCGKNYFSELPSYQQFCIGLESNLIYLAIINTTLTKVNAHKKTDFFIIDSTPLPICKNVYRSRSKLGKNIASSGKNMNGFYFGFKLHIIINDSMDIVAFKFTKGSVSDIAALDKKMVEHISGYLIGDKGYIGKEKAQKLRENNVNLITRPRKNMKKLPVSKKILNMISKRQIVETTFSLLKSKFSIIFQHARSLKSFFSQVFAAIFSYNIYRNDASYYLEKSFFCLS